MRRIFSGWVCGLTAMFIAGPASAEPQQAVRVDAGFLSAVGELGVVYQADVSSHVAFEGGAGVGFTGLQLSAMVKGALPVGSGKLTTGAGLSVAVPALGIEGVQSDQVDGAWVPSGETIPWLNIDAIGWQRQYGRTVLAMALGVTLPLRSWTYDVADVGDTIDAMAPFPQARVGIGRAF
jgi:hypothetical protein